MKRKLISKFPPWSFALIRILASCDYKLTITVTKLLQTKLFFFHQRRFQSVFYHNDVDINKTSVNSTAKVTNGKWLYSTLISFPLDIWVIGLLDHMVLPLLMFWETSFPLPIRDIIICIPGHSAQGSAFPRWPELAIFSYFSSEMMSHHGFHL